MEQHAKRTQGPEKDKYLANIINVSPEYPVIHDCSWPDTCPCIPAQSALRSEV